MDPLIPNKVVQSYSILDCRDHRLSGSIQRRVSVTSDNKDSSADYVTLNSIAFGQTIAGGIIENFEDSNFSTLSSKEKIAMVGHGSIGSSGEYSGEEIADKLTKGEAAMPDGDHDIIFTSCDAGTALTRGGSDAVIDTVKNAILATWPSATATVTGAEGASVKTITGTGQEAWGVVKNDPFAEKIAGDIEDCLNTVYKVKIKNPYGLDRENDLIASDLVEKALDVQKKKKDYFMDFIHLINGEWDLVSLDTQTAISKTFDPVRLSTIKNGGIKAGVRRI
ncbi:hypothetical protein [Akkermansia glycaniphila]|uniref:hypothetical protein n=1 Tax=Akkermansia glycaniphila TaxID=1679444 RepID=UPI001561564D|nr:hypothetical protein [Akkermansia glycaniphila]